MRARWYDPTAMQFDSLDPLAGQMTDLATGPCVYADGDPARFVDPSGQGITDDLKHGAAATVGFAEGVQSTVTQTTLSLSQAQADPIGTAITESEHEYNTYEEYGGGTTGALVAAGQLDPFYGIELNGLDAYQAAQAGNYYNAGYAAGQGSTQVAILGAAALCPIAEVAAQGAAAGDPAIGSGPKLSPKFELPTNAPQLPPTDYPPGWRVRERPPVPGYPNGYWKLEKPMPQGGWQGIDPSTMKPGSHPETHVPFPEGGPLMYGFPSDLDPQVFVGRELETITYAVNVVVLAFADRLTVSASGSVSYRVANATATGVDRPPVTRTSLVSLVGRTVLAAELKSARELVLKFDGEGSVTLLDDADTYECYLISDGDREFVV